MAKNLAVGRVSWNLSALASGDNDQEFEIKRQRIKQAVLKFVKKWSKRSDYLQEPEILKKALDEYELLRAKYWMYGDEYYYFSLRSTQDQDNPKIKAALNNVIDFAVQLENDIQFFEITISKIDKKRRGQFLKHAGLAPYRHFLEKLFAWSDYTLTTAEEKIINLKAGPAYGNWIQMTSEFLSTEQREVLTESGKRELKNFTEIDALFESKKKEVRDSAAEAFNDVLWKHSSVAEWEMNSILENKKIDDRLRGFSRADQSRYLAHDMETQVVDALVQTVTEGFSVSKQYYQFKAKLLGLPKFAYHERNIKYGSAEKKYSYKESAELVYRVFANLDGQFADIFAQFVDNGQVDVFPKKGKSGGAYCSYNMITQPVYVMLNHNNELSDVTTIAHEFGHAINDELSREKQNSLNFGTSLATAEVASTFMEDFVLEEILKDADDELRLSIMINRLDGQVATIFRQIAAANFERELHVVYRQQGYLSKVEIGKLFQKHMRAYMGPAVEQSVGSENWWVYWSHYRNFFYTYTYASGLLISKYLQASVHSNPEYIEKVKEFLSAGMSESPRHIFKNLGVDIANPDFWIKGMDEVRKNISEARSLAKKLGKI